MIQKKKLSTEILFESQKSPPIEAVLTDDDLISALRNEYAPLFQYVLQQKNLTNMMSFVFTKTRENQEKSDLMTRNSVIILTSVSKKLQDSLQGSRVFIESIQNCTKSPTFASDLQLCGHFQRIVDNSLRHSNGSFLKNFPHMMNFLVKNISVLALKCLALSILSDFSDVFSLAEKEKIAFDLAASAKGESGYFSVVLIKKILEMNKSLYPLFQNDSVLRELLSAATGSASNKKFPALFEAEIFKVIEKLIHHQNSSNSLIEEFSKLYKFSEKNITCGTVASLGVFKEGLISLIPRFFTEPSITILNEAIIKCFQQISEKELGNVIEKCDLTDKIIKSFDSNIVNGHLIEMAFLIDKKGKKYTLIKSEKWQTFVKNKLIPHEEKRMKKATEDEATNYMHISRKVGLLKRTEDKDSINGIKTILELAQKKIEKNEKEIEKLKEGNAEDEEDIGIQSGEPFISSASGFSFTIPTVYQNDFLDSPVLC